MTFDAPGSPDVLRVAQQPIPDVRPGCVLIEVEAAGVSRADALQRQGKYPAPPGASQHLGLEVAGIITAVGDGVDQFAIGDAVCALCNGGGYAEYVNVPAGQVLPLPATWSLIEGATIPENFFTVYDNVFTRGKLRTGETLLVHGGSSGIGTTAIMLAKAFGAHVVATAGSAQKCAACLEVGADYAIDYRAGDFVAQALEWSGGRGVDVVLDIVGGDYINRDLQVLAVEGRLSMLATTGGRMAEIDIGQMLSRRLTVFGSSLRARSDDEKGAIASALRADVWPLLDRRDAIRPIVDSVFTFAQAADAHRRLEESKHVGKIVLVPDAPAKDA